jgi:hypothetical protein
MAVSWLSLARHDEAIDNELGSVSSHPPVVAADSPLCR